MRKKLSIDRIGMRGSIGLLLFGAFLLVLGIILQIRSMQLPENALACTAEITAFRQADESSAFQYTATLVSYSVGDEEYKDIPLGQYEGYWKVGDKIDIWCSAADHTHIWTKTMQYQGVFYIVFSSSFLLIAIYKMVQFRKIKGINDDESDTDITGEEKFKISSAVIPILSGLPLIVAGITFGVVEKNPVLSTIIVCLGGVSCLTGFLSLMDYISFKNIQRHNRKDQMPAPEN